MSTKGSKKSKPPRRPKIPIEPIHVEELLGGAGMSGFLGVLDPPEVTTHLEKLMGGVDPFLGEPRLDMEAPTRAGNVLEMPARVAYASSEISVRVASVVQKVEALAQLIGAKTSSEAKADGPQMPLDIRSAAGEKPN